jgi:hypothetical protein
LHAENESPSEIRVENKRIDQNSIVLFQNELKYYKKNGTRDEE